jgi:PAS domain S-box-containing protein
VTISPIKDGDGRLIGAATIAHDITQRKQMERDRLLMVAIVNASDDAILSKTLDGIIITWNRAAERMFGYTADEIIGKPKTVLFPPDRLQEEEVILHRVRLGILTDHFETVRLHKNGTPLDVSVTITPIKDGDGQIIGASTIARDISGRKRAEQALRESETRLQQAQHIAHIGSWEHDLATGRILWSEEMFRLYRFDPAEGMPTFDRVLSRFHPDDWVMMQPIIAAATASGERFEYDMRLRFEDGTLTWGHMIGTVERDEVGRAVRRFGTFMDITERKQMEQVLQQQSQELARSNADLEQFAYVASHDLQEPLRMIGSYLGLLDSEYKDRLGAEAHEYIAFAVDGAVRMQALVKDLLDYARIGAKPLMMEPTLLDPLLREVLTDLQLLIVETDAVITCDPLPTVSADASQLCLVLQNLIGNAIKFRGAEAPRVHLSAIAVDGEWRLSVQDNGIGMKAEHAERIFVIFQRLHTRTKYAGTGIGLSTCKRVIERHGGRIWVESEPGKGSTFCFTLPQVPAIVPMAQAA